MKKYLLEIKNRIFLLVITVLSTSFINYLYKEILLFLITQPERFTNNNVYYSNFYFIFTDVTEILTIYIKLITFLGYQLLLIFIIYHCFVFFTPAMFKSEYLFLFSFLKIIMIICFVSVTVFNFLLIPITWEFFYSFQELISSKFINLHFEAKLIEYLDFYVFTYYFCVIYFQIFFIFFLFFRYVINNTKIIKKFRKIYYYFFVIFSSFISPPDLLSQFFISFLLITMYEILIFLTIIDKKLVR